jgi:hypothetical protein
MQTQIWVVEEHYSDMQRSPTGDPIGNPFCGGRKDKNGYPGGARQTWHEAGRSSGTAASGRSFRVAMAGRSSSAALSRRSSGPGLAPSGGARGQHRRGGARGLRLCRGARGWRRQGGFRGLRLRGGAWGGDGEEKLEDSAIREELVGR